VLEFIGKVLASTRTLNEYEKSVNQLLLGGSRKFMNFFGIAMKYGNEIKKLWP
jgi:hypothetical protein